MSDHDVGLLALSCVGTGLMAAGATLLLGLGGGLLAAGAGVMLFLIAAGMSP